MAAPKLRDLAKAAEDLARAAARLCSEVEISGGDRGLVGWADLHQLPARLVSAAEGYLKSLDRFRCDLEAFAPEGPGPFWRTRGSILWLLQEHAPLVDLDRPPPPAPRDLTVAEKLFGAPDQEERHGTPGAAEERLALDLRGDLLRRHQGDLLRIRDEAVSEAEAMTPPRPSNREPKPEMAEISSTWRAAGKGRRSLARWLFVNNLGNTDGGIRGIFNRLAHYFGRPLPAGWTKRRTEK